MAIQKRKTRDYWAIGANFGYGHGWEEVTAADRFSEARQLLKNYRENDPQHHYSIKLKREKIEENPSTSLTAVTMKKVGDNYNVCVGGTRVGSFPSKAEAERYGKHLIQTRKLMSVRNPSRVDEINSRGMAGGWHAEQLAARAKREGRSMADVFADSVRGSSAFSVPARATKATAAYITYRFSDGSTAKFVNTRGK
jgi:hypothetical protein